MNQCFNPLQFQSGSPLPPVTTSEVTWNGGALNFLGFNDGANYNNIGLAIDAALQTLTTALSGSTWNYTQITSNAAITNGGLTINSGTRLDNAFSQVLGYIGTINTTISGLGLTSIAGGTFANITGSPFATLNAIITGLNTDIGTLKTAVAPIGTFETTADVISRESDHFVNFIVASGLGQSSTGLSYTIAAGTGYVGGVRLTITSATGALTATSDNYLYLQNNSGTGTIIPVAVPISGSPTPPSNSIVLWKLTTNGSAVTAVADLRNFRYLAAGQFNPSDIGSGDITSAMLANTAVTAGSYVAANITVNAQGQITAASSIFNITSVTNGQLLQYNSTATAWENVNLIGSGGLFPTGTNGQFPVYNGSGGFTATTITSSNLSDFNLTSPANFARLTYDTATSKIIFRNEFNRVTLTGTATLTIEQTLAAVNTTSAAFTLTLPAASTFPVGVMYIIKDEGYDCATHNLTIAIQSGDKWNNGSVGVGTTMSSNGQVIKFYSDGSAFHLV
jgi:hypothetical protein